MNACVRFTFDLCWDAHVSPFYSQLGWLQADDRRSYLFGCLIFSVLRSSTPSYLASKLSPCPRPKATSRASRVSSGPRRPRVSNLHLSAVLCRSRPHVLEFPSPSHPLCRHYHRFLARSFSVSEAAESSLIPHLAWHFFLYLLLLSFPYPRLQLCLYFFLFLLRFSLSLFPPALYFAFSSVLLICFSFFCATRLTLYLFYLFFYFFIFVLRYILRNPYLYLYLHHLSLFLFNVAIIFIFICVASFLILFTYIFPVAYHSRHCSLLYLYFIFCFVHYNLISVVCSLLVFLLSFSL